MVWHPNNLDKFACVVMVKFHSSPVLAVLAVLKNYKKLNN